MTADTKIKVLNYLEGIQRECLQNRFGANYEEEFIKMQLAKEKNFDIESFLAAQPSMTDAEKKEFKVEIDLHKKNIKPYTKFQDIQSYSILHALFDKIEATAKKIPLDEIAKPIIGTALSKEYNAFAEKVPNTEEYLIVFEGELFTLANLLAKLFALSLPDFKITLDGVSFNFKKERIENHVQTNPTLRKTFADIVYNAIYHGQPNKTEQYYLSGQFGKLHYELLNSLEMFVVGHEYGHIYCGHFNEANLIKKIVGKKSLDRISPEWEMEYEADMVGLLLMMNSLDNTCLPPFSFLGPELFFTFLDLNDRANNLFSEGIERRSFGCDSHPPTFERRNRIRQNLKNSLPQDHLESYESLSEFLENIFEVLWADFKNNYIKNENTILD